MLTKQQLILLNFFTSCIYYENLLLIKKASQYFGSDNFSGLPALRSREVFPRNNSEGIAGYLNPILNLVFFAS